MSWKEEVIEKIIKNYASVYLITGVEHEKELRNDLNKMNASEIQKWYADSVETANDLKMKTNALLKG
jgi:hypothetical protein